MDKRKKNRVIQKKKRELLKDLRGRYSKGSRGRPQNRYSKGKRGGVRKEGFQNRKVYKRPLLNGRIVLLLFLMYLLIEKSNI